MALIAWKEGEDDEKARFPVLGNGELDTEQLGDRAYRDLWKTPEGFGFCSLRSDGSDQQAQRETRRGSPADWGCSPD